ncbi:MAG: glycosyltransferase [Acetobacteraceae bacterium]|nr:glycosyltransferase [Acetobacteraceae bacterium]
MTLLVILSFLIWVWLLTMRGQFWRAGPILPAAVPSRTPPVAVVVPARDEAPVIERSLRSLLNQNYPGQFRITLVDDQGKDGTGMLARSIGDSRLTVLTGTARPAGWAGKLWAVSQGVTAAGAPEYFFLTDADIEHAPSHLSSLVAMAEHSSSHYGQW